MDEPIRSQGEAALDALPKAFDRIQRLEDLLQQARGALADIGQADDMGKLQMRHKAMRVYRATNPDVMPKVKRASLNEQN